jgi:hypothetical protein
MRFETGEDMLKRRATLTGLIPAFLWMSVGIADASPVSPVALPSPSVQMSSYDDHLDAIVTTDSSSEAQANSMGINYSPSLSTLEPSKFPKIYLVKGAAASEQLWVLGAEPGEANYSPIWDEVIVTWRQGTTPMPLTSDTQIEQLATVGDLTARPTGKLLDAAVIAEDVAPGATVELPTVFETFYDAHEDAMLATDVSTEAQAAAEHINYSAVLAGLGPSRFPEIYIVRGPMAEGQLMVLGSEPGEANYSPIWLETIVHWKPGVSPTVIKSDTKIDKLIAAGKVTERGTTVLLNCPVVG